MPYYRTLVFDQKSVDDFLELIERVPNKNCYYRIKPGIIKMLYEKADADEDENTKITADLSNICFLDCNGIDSTYFIVIDLNAVTTPHTFLYKGANKVCNLFDYKWRYTRDYHVKANTLFALSIGAVLLNKQASYMEIHHTEDLFDNRCSKLQALAITPHRAIHGGKKKKSK